MHWHNFTVTYTPIFSLATSISVFILRESSSFSHFPFYALIISTQATLCISPNTTYWPLGPNHFLQYDLLRMLLPYSFSVNVFNILSSINSQMLFPPLTSFPSLFHHIQKLENFTRNFRKSLISFSASILIDLATTFFVLL